MKVLLLCLLAHQLAYAWGSDGHKIVAQIAENHLDDRAAAALALDRSPDLERRKQRLEDKSAAQSRRLL